MCRNVAPRWLFALVLTTACHAQPKEAVQPEKFLVTQPLRTDTELTRAYVAQIRAIQHIELRALERGYLQDVYVDEGQRVKKGDKLFRLRPAVYQAELEKATASEQLKDIEYSNTKSLADKNVVSNKEVSMAKARADEAKARVELAQTRKSMTEFNAPFDGLVGKFSARVGSLVDEGDLMTTLSDTSTLWVYFNVSETDYLNHRALFSADAHTPVRLQMANGEIYGTPGVIQTVESDFDNTTGNLAIRTGFANAEGLLRHGETGKILVTLPLKGALLIPQEATFDVLDKKFVYVVDKSGTLHARAVTVSAEMPQLFAISQGLSESDRILVEGLRKVGDGSHIACDLKPPQQVIKTLQVPAE